MYFCNGLYGGFWGIVAGPIGIRMSKSNNLSQTKCLWRAYIPLIFITVVGSTAGFIMSIFLVVTQDFDSEYYIAMSCIEIIVIFGKHVYYNFILKHFQLF